MSNLLPKSFWTFPAASAIVIGLAATVIAADRAEVAYEEAKKALADGDFSAAIAKLDEAGSLAPKEAKYRGLRGLAWLRKGDYEKGTTDLKTAIALNPGDAGQAYRPSSGKKLSDAALEHGRKQVAQMLRDRPAMNDYHKETGFLRDWAERKFAGEDFGEVIDWDSSPPLHSDAEHLSPGNGQRAAILVAPHYTAGPKLHQPRSFEELWAGAIYELHNVSYARQYMRLNDEAEDGKISKEAFVGGILTYELAAAQHTRAFYLQVFLPWAEKKKLATDPSLWFCDWWASPENVLKSFTNKSAYPWRPYAWTHDWATVHHLFRVERFDKARKVLQRMREEQGYDDEQADVALWLGRCLAKLNKPTEAIAALTDAIDLDPHNVAAYRARSEQHEKLGEKAKAKADADEAKKLESDK